MIDVCVNIAAREAATYTNLYKLLPSGNWKYCERFKGSMPLAIMEVINDLVEDGWTYKLVRPDGTIRSTNMPE